MRGAPVRSCPHRVHKEALCSSTVGAAHGPQAHTRGSVVLLVLVRGEDHDHPPAFHFRLLVDAGNLLKLLNHPAQQVHSLVLVDDVAPLELDVRLDLVAVFQEFAGVIDLEVEVVLLGPGPEAELLHLHGLRLLPAPLLLLLLLVAVLAVVEDLADGRVGVRRNLHEIEFVVAGAVEGLAGRDHVVVAVGFDHTDLVGTNFLIYAEFIDVSNSGIGGFSRGELGDSEKLGLCGANAGLRHEGPSRRMLYTWTTL